MTVIINVRNPHGGDTYIARGMGFRPMASSTGGRQTAAQRCAEKIAAGRKFTLKTITSETYLCEIVDPAD
jgi:hypothetical protein